MIKLHVIPLLILCLAITCNLNGQQNSFISFRNYNQGEGLSSYNITKILQDQYGFIWVGTQDGINCFDGNHFLVFNKESEVKNKLPGNNITDIVEDTSGKQIWAATSLGGIVGIDTRTQTVLHSIRPDTTNKRFKDIWIHSLAICGNELWIGAYGGLFVYNITTGKFRNLDSIFVNELNIYSLNITKLLCDHMGQIWAFCNGLGILVISQQTGKLLAKIPKQQFNFFKASKELLFWNVFESDGHEVYMSTSWGLRKIQNDSGKIHLEIPESSDFYYRVEIFACAMDKDNRLWFSDVKSLFRQNKNETEPERIIDINHGADSWQSTAYALHIDMQGNIWAGSQDGLSFLQRNRQPFDKFYQSFFSATKIQHAFTLHIVDDSILYCGSAAGLYKVNLKSRYISEIDNGGSCYMIDTFNYKQLIISNSKGLFLIINDKLVPAGRRYPYLKPIEHDQLCASIRYNDSITIYASQLQKGLYVCNTKKKTITQYNSGNSQLALENNVINSMFLDNEKRLWILSINTIFLFDPLTGVSYPHQINHPGTKEKCGILFDMCETANSYWIAGYGEGLIETDKQFRSKQILSKKDGISNNGVYKVFSYHDSLVLITSNDGLSTYRISDHHIKNYYATDGLQSSAFEQFCGIKSQDMIYAGGVNGFTKIDPAYLTFNKIPPTLYISRIKTDYPTGYRDTTNILFNKFTILSNVLQTTVYFSILDYSIQENSNVDYKIKELNDDWIHLNGQRFVSLIGLTPGTYTLMVRSANADGIWSFPKEIKLIFLPKWYQTLWFKFLIFILIAGLFYTFFRYRIYQIKKQGQIRKDIASDLHDDIGSTLNTVKIFTHLAKKEPNNEDHLNQIEESLTQASSGLRDMIWVLDESRDTIYELMERIKKYAYPVCRANQIRLETSVDANTGNKLISKTEKRNLLLISKEAVNNSIKYARCSRIWITLQQTNGKNSLMIGDDGGGFNIAQPTEGNGLNNIKQRANQIQYRIRIISSTGKGTLIELNKI